MDKKYSDVSTAKSQKNDLQPEEYPEGAYGSPILADEPVYGKSTPWKEGQHRKGAYRYEYREFHKDIPRQAPEEKK